MTEKLVVTFNAGSSSLRSAVYRLGAGGPVRLRSYSLRGLPNRMILSTRDPVEGTGEETDFGVPSSTERAHPEALAHMFGALDGLGALGTICAFSHRVVHGGTEFIAPVRVTEEVLARLTGLETLAPAHQPHNLRPIRQLQEHYLGIPHFACFDTAFHRTQRREAQIFGLPRALTEDGVIRYGFHGLSYDYIAHKLQRSFPDLAAKRVIVAHLGHGVSMCALDRGRSVATTMGMTALDGLPMGHRSGAVDPGILLHLMLDRGYSPEDVRELLYTRSGLLGVSGISDEMNDLLASDRVEAAEAVDYFVFRCRWYFGALAATLGGVDAVVLTGGMGKYIPQLRARLVAELEWLGAELDPAANAADGPFITTQESRLPVLMLPTDEERVLARCAYTLLGEGGG
ncbi:acetate/propionate family kinase [Marimonas sp. MJW-29]|uniref:Acetate kinase n=1 Tax=Sulfitobacter sediminis TaxID=3234186 RepID=A0ABV3RQY3_9RHOB